jgi:signal transduction histidine kinase
VGVVTVSRRTVRPFTDRQIALVQTFADQAVIAIENTRLFEAEQASKRELQESLEYQTATSDVLRVISNSPTDIKPVLRAICETASRICEAQDATVFLRDGSQLKFGAHHGSIPNVDNLPISRDLVTGRAVLDRRPIHVHDLADAVRDFPLAHEMARRMGHRTILTVPLMREDVAIGVIGIRRTEVKPFTDRQIDLLKTFADQAVIAIENARLFEAEQASKRELARSVEELESLGKVSQAVNSSLELDKVLPTILEHACAMSYAGGGTVYVFDKATSGFRLAAAHNMSDEHIAMVRAQPIRLNSVVVGECATRREVVQVADLSSAAPSPLLDILLRTGVRAVLAVPLLHQAEVVGVLVVRRNQPGTFSPEVIQLVEAFAAQSAIAVENARLFGEIAHKSRELEIASQHKSQFVANMSHELRTPLAAILGYAELMQEGFYEPQGPKSLDALTRIRSNGKHLLGLINSVLDIAKIESGQFTLNMSEYAIETVVETVRSATESLAQNKKLALKTEVAQSLPIGLGDEQRLTQVLLNLVGNAIKFTDAGEIRVTAKVVNGNFAVSVADTGPGIPEEHQARIFDQFHQVDSSNTKAKGGTGLGLAIAKQIVEMHGGRIWVESTLGRGSTFQMELPTRAELRRSAP